jgi:hypothetical protein
MMFRANLMHRDKIQNKFLTEYDTAEPVPCPQDSMIKHETLKKDMYNNFINPLEEKYKAYRALENRFKNALIDRVQDLVRLKQTK